MTTFENRRTVIKKRRLRRLLRLIFLTKVVYQYLNIGLKRRLLESENTWKSAEQAKAMVDFLFPEKEVKTEDFIHDKNMLSDEIIDEYGTLKQYMDICCPALKIPEKAVLAFCKHENATRQIFTMKEFDCIHYELYLNNLFSYITGEIGKDKLREGFFVMPIFFSKKSPANLARFRRSMIRAELLLEEIMEKQLERGKAVACEDIINFKKNRPDERIKQ